LAGGAIGVGMGGWDAFQAIRNPEGFVGGALTRGLAAFLGGRETGAAGAKHGALKGAGIGAAIGFPFGGPIGSAIGAAIGGVAGGILGFVGGKALSRGLKYVFDPIQKLAKGVWAVITFPYKMIKETVKFFKGYFTKTETGKALWKKIKFWAPKIMFPPLMMLWAVKKTYRIFKSAGEKMWEKIKDTWIGRALTIAWDMVTLPFRWMKEKLTPIWNDFKEGMNIMIQNFLAVPKAIRSYINDLIEKIKSIPFIGRFLKGLKEIHEGTFAEHRIQEIKTAEKQKTMADYYRTVGTGAAGSRARPFELPEKLHGNAWTREYQWQRRKTAMDIAMGVLGATAAKWKNGVLTKARIKGTWYDVVLDGAGQLKELRPSAAQAGAGDLGKQQGMQQTATAKTVAQQIQEQTGALNKTLGETSKASMNTTMTSANTIVNNMNNISSTQGGGGMLPGMSSFGSGSSYAADVERCNIN